MKSGSFFYTALSILALSTLMAGLPPQASAETAATTVPNSTELGPAIGASIPHNLSLNDSAGLPALAGDKGALIIFVRSVSWCPYCQKQVLDLLENEAAFTAQGLNLVFITYDSAAKQAAFQAKNKLTGGTFISDPQSEIIDAFGLRNETHKEGSFAYGIPHPAIFVVDDQGMVLNKLYETDYASNKKSYVKRPAVEVILAAVATAFMP